VIDKNFFDNVTTLTKEIKSKITKSSWSMDQVFYFVNHPGALNLSFPCVTDDGVDPGKPCAFPFEIDVHACSTSFTSRPSCATRRFANTSILRNEKGRYFFSFCPKDCNGEKPEPHSPYNLARRGEVWTSQFYNLETFGAGLCHTYDPPSKTLADRQHRLAARLQSRPPGSSCCSGTQTSWSPRGALTASTSTCTRRGSSGQGEAGLQAAWSVARDGSGQVFGQIGPISLASFTQLEGTFAMKKVDLQTSR
jgi:hypothetical protein